MRWQPLPRHGEKINRPDGWECLILWGAGLERILFCLPLGGPLVDIVKFEGLSLAIIEAMAPWLNVTVTMRLPGSLSALTRMATGVPPRVDFSDNVPDFKMIAGSCDLWRSKSVYD
jgi:hypothetical protein